jgi:hypothetical protein
MMANAARVMPHARFGQLVFASLPGPVGYFMFVYGNNMFFTGIATSQSVRETFITKYAGDLWP